MKNGLFATKAEGAMRLLVSGLFAVAACLQMAVTSNAASRVEFDQVVTQLQAKPADNALRERVIKMSLELKPAPAVPEAAREQFVTGPAIAKAAKDASGQKLAVKKFEDALKKAPWWGDAYYNLSFSQELAGQFDAAVASLRFYLLTNPSEKEAREAKDRIYALKGKAELAKAEKSKKDTEPSKAPAAKAAQTPPAPNPAEVKLALLRSLNGAKYFRRNEWSPTSVEDEFWTITNEELVVSRNQINPQEITSFASPPEYWHWQDGEFRRSAEKLSRVCISTDGQQLSNCLTGEILGQRTP